MVHYIINPWRFRHELLEVRKELYPATETTNTQDIERGRRHAIALVSVWEQRGNCPHLVASTALLTAAIVNDTPGVSSFCVRAAYAVAFSRFVTGLLDGYQDKKYKLSMYSIAKTINLPATFVELRHQATHEDLPSLNKLRIAAQKAMQWIWDFYWKDLSATDEQIPKVQSTVGKDGEDEKQTRDLDAFREELRLEREMMTSESGSQSLISESPVRDLDSIRREMMMVEEDIESSDGIEEPSDEIQKEGSEMDVDMDDEDAEDSGSGWDLWTGPWVPKPIGVTL